MLTSLSFVPCSADKVNTKEYSTCMYFCRLHVNIFYGHTHIVALNNNGISWSMIHVDIHSDNKLNYGGVWGGAFT